MEMFKRLRIKIIISVLSVLTVSLFLLFFILNGFMVKSEENQTERIINNIYNEINQDPPFRNEPPETMNRRLPPPKKDEQGNFNENRPPKPILDNPIRNYFAVELDQENNIQKIIRRFPLRYTNEEITTFISEITQKKQLKGIHNGFRYQIKTFDDKKIVAIVDRKAEDSMQEKLYRISVLIFLISELFGLLVAHIFANWAVKPVALSMQKQKEFIANASHELKTPLGVINASVDILASDYGENKWIDTIKNEVLDMNKLIKDLLYLAQIDSDKMTYKREKFNLSNLILKDSLTFESIIFEQKKEFDVKCADDITIEGDEQRIHQLFLILLDNAIKHTSENDVISIKLNNLGNKVLLEVNNTGEGIDESEKDKIFERFYRSDSSRTRATGGTGLGLSIAKEIVELHKGKISVESEKGKFISFFVTL